MPFDMLPEDDGEQGPCPDCHGYGLLTKRVYFDGQLVGLGTVRCACPAGQRDD